MQVNKTQGDIARTQAAQRAQQGGVPIPVASDPIAAVSRVDAVQISDAGRALSGSDASTDAASNAEGLDPRRADEIRTRILSGAYNSVEMADQVARSILRSGDL